MMQAVIDITQSPEARRLIVESKALRAALAQTDDAQELVRQAYGLAPTSSLVDNIVRWSMRVILGETIEPGEIAMTGEPDHTYFGLTALAWAHWRTGEPAPAQDCLIQAGLIQGVQGRALHMMALQLWKAAIQALVDEQPEEAKKLYRRAMEMSAQMGTSTSQAIHWTYAASFFRHERPPEGAATQS